MLCIILNVIFKLEDKTHDNAHRHRPRGGLTTQKTTAIAGNAICQQTAATD